LERLILITDRRLGEVVPVMARALSALPAGAAMVLLREKDLGGRALLALGSALAGVCAGRARLVVSDRADVAAALGAGVHLPEDGLTVAEARQLVPWVGVSTHAQRVTDADYALLGPIFDTPSKRAYGAPLGTAVLRGSDAFAVGGIDGPAQARAVRAAGARGVAVIRAVMGAKDPAAAATALWDAINDRRT
jgi:thiamine-phosphate pyrophosphorylase